MKKIVCILIIFISFFFIDNIFSLENESISKVNNVNLKISNSNKNILLTWEKDYISNGYKIYRSDKKNGKYKKISTTKENSFINKNLKYGKTYYYKIVSYNDISFATSNIVSLKVLPNKVKGFKVVKSDTNNIKLSWNKESVSGYEIYRSTNNKSFKKIKTITRNSIVTFNNTKLKTDKTYYYKIRSYVKVNGKKIYSGFSSVISSKTLTKKEKNALARANELLKFKYSKNEFSSKLNVDSKTMNFVVKQLNIDFNKNAYDNMLLYLKICNLSKEETIKQLENYDKFTHEEVINSINKYNGEYKDGTSSLNNKYKKDLYLLGYNSIEIDDILNKFSINEINSYLMNKKYNNLIDFIKSPYFKIKNINRYQTYYNKNKHSVLDTVIYVEIGLDYSFYTNIKKANVSDGKLILINKYNYHDKNYNANLEKLGNGYGNGSLNKEAAQHFRNMVNDARKEGIKLWSVSAYRSYSTQKSIYNGYVKKDGVKKADTYSARPGHSEHSTGLAVDINTASSSSHFENTKEYKWLKANSYKYGFVERYLKGKEFITGYKYEPWHFRYFGEEVATKLYELNITYEEYLIIKDNL